METLQQTKQCSKCGEEKPFSEFRDKVGAKNGKNYCCKPCESKAHQQRVRNRVAAGICFYCGKKERVSGKRFCNDCGTILNSKSKIYRDAMASRGLCYRCGATTDTGQTKCSGCIEKTRIYEFNKRKAFYEKVGNYFNNRCYICGLVSFEYHIFDCHHIDPNQKDFQVSSMSKRKWNLVLNELQKCIYVCSNCHRRVQYGYLDESIENGELVIISGREGILYREEMKKWQIM
jgi:hypothetical protein